MMMPSNNYQIQGIGTDIIEVQRIRKAIERHGDRFLKQLFTEKERAYCSRYKDATPHYAGRFAAKEAILKAFGTGLRPELSWQEIEILNNSHGKPEVQVASSLLQTLSVTQIFLSISHCDAYATATAITVG